MFAVAFLLVVVAATTWWFWFKAQARKKAVIPHNSDVIIQDLYVYPVKSCKGFRVDKWPVCETGFLYDRKWMVVENGTFNFVTQRQDARMALIQPTLDDNQLRLSAPGMESITVCSLPPNTKEWMVDNQGAIRDKIYVTVWESKVTAIDMGEEVSAWLSKYLGKDVRLAMYPLKSDEHDLRDIPEKWSQDVDKLQEDRKGTENWHKSPAFADEYPFLAISQESLDHFKKQIGREIFMNRFRPNIVVKGCAYPHEEDEWMECASGNDGAIKLFGCKPCQRCPVTCVVQEKGISESESTEGTVDDPAKCTKIESVLQALGKYRKSPNFAFGPLFGQNLVHALPDQGSQQESSSTSEVRAALNLQEILAENGEKHGIYCLHTGNTLQVRSWRDENYVDQFLQLNTQ